MGKIFLTQAQKLENRYAELRKCIGKRVEWAMDDRRLTQKALAEEMGHGHTTIKKICEGTDVMMTTTEFLRFLDVAGLKLVDIRKDAIQKEAER